PIEQSSIGMNATTATRGALRPTAMTTKVRVAARLYAGAVEATPITTLETRPSAPLFRPLSSYCSVGCADAVVAMSHPPGVGPAGPGPGTRPAGSAEPVATT